MALSNGSTRLRRGLVALVLAGSWWSLTAMAAMAGPQGLPPGLEDGALDSTAEESGEAADLARALRNAIDPDLDASVVVLATSVDDIAGVAQSLATALHGPVVVVTPDGYAISATAPARTMTRDASAGFVPARVADDIAFFMARSNPSGTSWGISLVIPVVTVALLAAGLRVGEHRTTKQSRASALREEWERLAARADALADPVLELSTRIELDGRPRPVRTYRHAASEYGSLRDALGRPASATTAATIRERLDDLELRFVQLETMLDDR